MRERIKQAAGRVVLLEQQLKDAQDEYDELLNKAIEAGTLKKSAVGRKVDRSNVTKAERKMWTHMRVLAVPAMAEDIATAAGLHPGTVRRFLARGKQRGVIEKVDVNRWRMVEE